VSEAWDGRPENPERDGWHWLCCGVHTYVREWRNKGYWPGNHGYNFSPNEIRRTHDYLGPALLPSQVAAADAKEKSDAR
jgi:hypothetical protein